jgi:hypothetical protein
LSQFSGFEWRPGSEKSQKGALSGASFYGRFSRLSINDLINLPKDSKLVSSFTLIDWGNSDSQSQSPKAHLLVARIVTIVEAQ